MHHKDYGIDASADADGTSAEPIFMMRFTIELSIELDSALTIPEMKAEVIKDVKRWLATAPIMSQLAEAEDSLTRCASATARREAAHGQV